MNARIFAGILSGICFAWCGTAAAAEPFTIDPARCTADRQYLRQAEEPITDPLQRALSHVLSRNELSDGCGAYQLIDAKMASNANGFSIGAPQFDLAINPTGRALFERILACAPSSPERAISADDAAFLRTDMRRAVHTIRTATPADYQRWVRLEPQIEDRLASDCGRAILDPAHREHLTNLVAGIASSWAHFSAVDPNASANATLIQLLLLDYSNVLGGTNSLRTNVRDGRDVCGRLCAAGVAPRFQQQGAPGFTDIMRYWLTATCYGVVPERTRRFDSLRRLNTVFMETDVATLAMTDRDKAWLIGDFANMLAELRAAQPRQNVSTLDALVTAANGGQPVAGAAVTLTADQLALARRTCAR
jgi:hypothetical protein